MFRVRVDEEGKFPKDLEAEIEFIGGSKTHLHGDSAGHFIKVVTDHSMNR